MMENNIVIFMEIESVSNVLGVSNLRIIVC